MGTLLREGFDFRTGLRAEHEQRIDEVARAACCGKTEQAARSAASRRDAVQCSAADSSQRRLSEDER
ncbi:hypothetical protein [Streptomyces sp. IBSBF 2390]|uniref:hypothetical protein n=1 Tax=Streptomyces sp. IBSBF 2390 TaxID=2903533 RepID=UPI003FA7B8DA